VDADHLVRDLLEVLIVVAVGGMLVSAVRALRRGEIEVFTCPSCGRPTTRANGICKHCGAPLEDEARRPPTA
jgi:predicted amidophosphoribosyltransferase